MTTIPTLLGTGGHADGSFTAPNYYSNVGLGRCPFLAAPFTTESYVSQTIRVAGAVSYLSWRLDTAFGTTLTLTLRRNSSNTALAISIGATTTGWVTDSTDSATVSSGDALDFAAGLGSTPITYGGNFYCISARFDATTGSAQMLAAVGYSGNSLAPTTKFVNFLGIAGNGLEADGMTVLPESSTQFYCLAAGTWQNMACHLESNTFDEVTTVTNRINGSNGHMAISISASTSGYFEDTSSIDKNSVSVGDLLDYQFFASASGSGSLGLDWIGAHFLATTTTQCMIGGSAIFPESIFSGTNYSSLFGGGDVETYTARATGLFPYDSIASNFTTFIPTAGGAATFTTMINGLLSTLTASCSAIESGYFTDTSHTVAFDVGDTCANRINVTSGTLTWASASLLLDAD